MKRPTGDNALLITWSVKLTSKEAKAIRQHIKGTRSEFIRAALLNHIKCKLGF